MIRRNRKVTPTGRHVLTYDEESWKPTPEEPKPEDISRTNEARQSKAKRVKKYLKKCKNVLGRSTSSDVPAEEAPSTSSWYLEELINVSEINELEDVYEDAVQVGTVDSGAVYQVASVVDDVKKNESVGLADSSPPLTEEQGKVDGADGDEEGEKPQALVKSDVASLVDKYFGSLYENYQQSKNCLVRQARDLLVCEYHGCLHRFENEFCTQAAKLLQRVKCKTPEDGSAPLGWPLCLGPSGVAIHLGPLDPSAVRNSDCYLCVRSRSAPGLELALIWRQHSLIRCHTVAEFKDPLANLDDIMCSNLRSVADLELTSYDDYDGAELPELLQNLLVSVERAIERVPLDDLTFPCPQCLQYLPLDRREDDVMSCACQCSCRLPDSPVLKRDSSIQTSPMFEFAGSIPHIDSDDEDDKDSVKSGSSSRKVEIARPKRITDLPEKLLMSGINLPGTADNDGRPIVLCYAECVARAGLNKYEIAKLLLYYSSIPTLECTKRGFTVLLLAESETDNKILELLDKSVALIANSMKVDRFLVWKPGADKKSQVVTSRIQAVVVADERTLARYLSKEETPASCGGSCSHDQLEWVEFFKQAEPFLASCKAAGRSLLSALSQLRNDDVPHQVTRRFLSHQCRQITKALDLEHVHKLRRDGSGTLSNLKERSQWLAGSRDVKRNVSFSEASFNSVERVSRRLEQLKQERAERLKELARFNTLKEEAEELLSWFRKAGEDSLSSLGSKLRSAGDVAGVKEVANDFEKLDFIAWRQFEKSGDLLEECKNINDPKEQNQKETAAVRHFNDKYQSLKDSAGNLQVQMKTFRERLEETRERLDDCTRCFLLLDSRGDFLEDDSTDLQDFVRSAEKSCNEKLLQKCKALKRMPVQPPDKDCSDPPTATSTPLKSHNSQIRRRSVSSLAFIYHCNHHAAGESCNCCESDTENTVSYKLKKKYIQTLQTACVCRDTLERKNSATLDGIKEERESVENLLEKLDDHRCDSGLSTADNSVGEESVYNKKKLQRTCSCQYYRESCAACSAGSSSAGSNQDHTDNQQDSIIEEGSDGFIKSNSSDDIEEENYSEEPRKVPPIPANNHLYCHASSLDLPSDALYSNMDPKTQKTLTFIIKEMIDTERDYVKSLDYIIVNYIPELMREDIPQALRGQRNIIFGNVEKIYEFHSQHFLHELEGCESNPLQVGQIFLKHDKKFYLYALYNKNKPKSDSLMSEYGTLFFKSKQLELKDRMDLASYLLKPVQRMGKYALLLQQMMKACAGPSTERIQELEDLRHAEEMVRFKLRHGNDLLAMDSIRECDVNLKEQGSLLRQNEFLVWEGRNAKKSLRQVFLFEELILFSKARRFPDRKNLDLYIYKNSIKMTDIGLTAKIGDSPTKFEIWFRKRKPNDTFTLQSMSEDVKKAWTEELSQLLWKQAIKNRAVRMAEMSSMGIGNKPCLDIRPSADQISDRSISVDQLSRTLPITTPTCPVKLSDLHAYIAGSQKIVFLHAAPRFRNSIVGPAVESCRNAKRPHSVISMSSSVSSGSTSSANSGGPVNSMNLSFESACDSPKPYHRSATLNSQCSTGLYTFSDLESGIIADMSMGSDECSEQTHAGL
ncbi:puratrophin-1-like isoform X4 [Tenebrio molitor]|uniref:puratrophin-1-like isoform X4 n=1 Tax=Tenebrio molitor TaxID=7067 RepID=UPI0036248377